MNPSSFIIILYPSSFLSFILHPSYPLSFILLILYPSSFISFIKWNSLYLFRDSSPQSTFHVFRLQALCLTQKSVLFCFVLFVCLFVCCLVFVSFHLTTKKQSKLLKIQLRVGWLLFLPYVAGDSLGNVKS